MDSAQFAKLCRDVQLLGKGGLDSIRVDLIFQKAIGKVSGQPGWDRAAHA